MAVVQMNPHQLNPRQRSTRRPAFPATGTMRPTGIYPIAAHRVLPGETLQTFNHQYRIVSRNLKNPLEGAWLNFWLVYVKLSDLDDDSETLRTQFHETGVSNTGWTASADRPRFFTKQNQLDWIYLSYNRVIESYFRDNDESATDHLIDTVAMQKIRGRHWGDNLLLDPGVEAVDTSDEALHEIHQAQAMLEHMMEMSEMDYSDNLQMYGVKENQTRPKQPEILAYAQQFSMPANHVEPSTGAPVSAWYFDGTFRPAAKARRKRFTEPGFVMLLCSVMPKFYLKHQSASIVGHAWDQHDWFPWYNIKDPSQRISRINVDPAGNFWFTASARTDVGNALYWYDRGDELSYGEPFVNNTSPPWDIPFSTGQTFNDADSKQVSRGEYALEADIDALFTGSTAAERLIQYGGLYRPNILGHISDVV